MDIVQLANGIEKSVTTQCIVSRQDFCITPMQVNIFEQDLLIAFINERRSHWTLLVSVDMTHLTNHIETYTM